MKKYLALIAFIFLSCSSFAQGITVFWDANWSGASLVIDRDWDAGTNPQWNDQISSIRIPAGYKIQVFEHGQFGGASKILSGDWTITDSEFNDIISSIKFLEYPSTQGITVFWDANWSGASLTITGDWDASSNIEWNDQISSIKIPAGYKIQIFEHSQFGGASKILTGDWTITDSEFNDIISSIKFLEYPRMGMRPHRMHSETVAAKNKLCCGQEIALGASLESLNGRFFLAFQQDRNLVVYMKTAGGPKPIWATATNGRVNRCVMQADGNFVLYNDGTAGWASNTNGNQNASLVMQDDGNLVIYATDARAIWASNTAQPAEQTVIVPVISTQVTTVEPCAMPDQLYNAAKAAVDAQAFRDAKMNMAKQAIRNKCLSLDQIRGIAKLFAFEDQTLEFLKYAYDFTNSKGEYYTLADVLTFNSNVENLTAFLATK